VAGAGGISNYYPYNVLGCRCDAGHAIWGLKFGTWSYLKWRIWLMLPTEAGAELEAICRFGRVRRTQKRQGLFTISYIIGKCSSCMDFISKTQCYSIMYRLHPEHND
jgi:hypothetical protein